MKSRGSLRWHFSASRKDTKREVNPAVAGSTFACQGQPTPRPTAEQLHRSHRHPALPGDRHGSTAPLGVAHSSSAPRETTSCESMTRHSPTVSRCTAPMGRNLPQHPAPAEQVPRRRPPESVRNAGRRILDEDGTRKPPRRISSPGTRERLPSRVEPPTRKRPSLVSPRCGNDGPAGPNEDPSETGTGRTSATIPPRVVDLRAQGGHEIRDRQVGGVRPACARCARGRRRGSLRSPRRKLCRTSGSGPLAALPAHRLDRHPAGGGQRRPA